MKPDPLIHLDLFSGIGGFAYAADQVWDNVSHTFCDNDKFCRQVLKKHWPGSKIYEDIRTITKPIKADILTGGFPCQPFSQAGKRKGVSDDRYLWPEMLRVIQLTQPEWVIAENVSGLLTMQGGVVFENVCLDLEASGYEVQPFIIPAAGVGAPHKRDRVWICAHANSTEYSGRSRSSSQANSLSSLNREAVLSGESGRTATNAANTSSPGSKRRGGSSSRWTSNQKKWYPAWREAERRGWNRSWAEVAAELCRVDDGLPIELDGLKLTKPGHRAQQIKAYGNAIVPEVAIEIMKGII